MTLLAAGSLLLIMLVLAAMPSASVALVVVRSATGGLKHGVAVTLGIVLADLLFVALVIAGMSMLAEWLGAFFVALRYLAGAYLIWFGIHLLRAMHTEQAAVNVPAKLSQTGSFLAGFFLTLGDVKAILFYASLLPAFVDLTQLSLLDVLMIGVVTILAVGGVKIGYAIGARRLMARAASSRKTRCYRAVGGTLMIGTGSYLMLKG